MGARRAIRCGRTAGVVIGLALLAVACGGDDDDDEMIEVQDPVATPTPTVVAPAPTEFEPEPTPTPTGMALPGGAELYVVESGDTLANIAGRFDLSVQDLIDANDLADPDVLRPGDELIIPSVAGAPDGEEPTEPADPASDLPAVDQPTEAATDGV